MTVSAAPTSVTLSGLRRGSLLNLAGAAVTTVCTFGVALATTHALDPSGAGVVFALTSAFLLAATVLRLGTPTALVLFIARTPDEDGSRSRAFTRLALRVVAPLAVGGALVAAGGAGLVRSLLPDSMVGRAAPLVVSLAVLLPFAVLLDSVLAVSRGHHRMAPTVAIERIARPAGQLALSLAALAWWPSVLGLGLAWAVPYVPALAAAIRATPQLRGRVAAAHVGADVGVAEQGEFRRFLVARTFVSVSQILFARLDVILLAALTDTRHAAIYTAATRFVVVAQLIQQSIGTAVEPGLARAMGSEDRALLGTLYKTGTSWLVWLAWPLLLMCAVLAPWWLRVFGRAYVDGVHVVYVLVVAMLVSTGIGTVETLLNMAGRARSLVFYNVIGLVLMTGLDVVLIPHLGALGAAIGWAATICFKNIAPLIEFRWTIGLHPLSGAWVVAAIVAVATGGVVPLAGRLLCGEAGALAGAAAGVALWSAAVWRRRGSFVGGGAGGRRRVSPMTD